MSEKGMRASARGRQGCKRKARVQEEKEEESKKRKKKDTKTKKTCLHSILAAHKQFIQHAANNQVRKHFSCGKGLPIYRIHSVNRTCYRCSFGRAHAHTSFRRAHTHIVQTRAHTQHTVQT